VHHYAVRAVRLLTEVFHVESPYLHVESSYLHQHGEEEAEEVLQIVAG